MVKFTFYHPLVLTFAITAANAIPLGKRVSQSVSGATQKWAEACNHAGGGERCMGISINAFTTLLDVAGPCEQQDAADAMIDLAKELNSDVDMIKFAQLFVQQPRSTPTNESVPYCQQPPRNAELVGLYQCQFEGAKQDTFVGGVEVGSTGTIPFGLTTPLVPAGSCPAHPDGPVPDGVQLVSITQDPGLRHARTNPGAPGVTSGSQTTFASSKRRRSRSNRILKRAAQDIAAATKPWEDACVKAGGGEEDCRSLASTASAALLSSADSCAQQDAADAMVDLAKTLNNAPDMIELAQVFVQQPRNTLTSEAVPYCQKVPKNSELQGLFQCQFQSTIQETFVGDLAVGSLGTIPFGQNAPVSPPGACRASPKGPIPDGQQLLDFIQLLRSSS